MKRLLGYFAVLLLWSCAPAVAPKPSVPDEVPVAKSVKVKAVREFVFHAWSISLSKPEGRKVLEELKSGVSGSQSRNLHEKLLELAKQGVIKRHEAPLFYYLEFHDADFQKMGGKVFWKNGTLHRIPKDFGPGQAVELVVYGTGKPTRPDGSLAFEVGPLWNTTKIAATIEIKVPDNLRYYPESGSLKTCGPATARICGGTYDPTKPTILFERLNSAGITHFHFVVR